MHGVKGEDAAPPTRAAGAGRLVAGRYRLHVPIGRGAMGVVWRGRDELLDREVAIKQVRSSGLAAGREDAYRRTLREAKAAARLNHPGVVTVFDVVEHDGDPWIVMELVSARSLDRLIIEDGPLPPRRAARIGEQLANALACAHAAGVLHRDVKPGNVLVGSADTAVLTDFGIATMAGDPGLTQAGMVFGTPGFTPPERLRGAPATSASDLWSLGATLYVAVEGRGPFDRPGGTAAVLAGVASEPAPQPPSAGPLGPVIGALLQADPVRRPDARTAARMLAEAAASLPGQAGPRGWSSPLSPVGAPGFSDLPGTGPRSFFDAPSLLDQPEFLAQSGLLDPPSGGPPAAVSHAVPPPPPAAGAAPRRRGGRVRVTALTLLAMMAAGIAGYAAYPRPSGLDITPPATPSPSAQSVQAPAARPAATPSSAARPAASATASGGAADNGAANGVPNSGAPNSGVPNSGVPNSGAANSGGSVAPAGYRWYQVTAAAAGTAAGFEIAVPAAWQASRQGLSYVLTAPDGTASVEVSLAPFRFARPVAEAGLRQDQAVRRDQYPGYRLASIRAGTFQGAPDAVWRFSFQGSGSRTADEELLVSLATSGGTQDYALTEAAPAAGSGPAGSVFRQMLATFRPVP